MLHVPNHFPIIGRLRFLFSNNIDTFDYFPNAENWDFPHIRFFNKTGLVSLSNLCGFEVLKDLSWHFVRPAILKGLLRIKGRSIVSRFSDALCEGTTLLLRKK